VESNCVHSAQRPVIGLLQPAPGDYDDGEFGGIMIGKGNRSTRRKPAPAPLCPPQIPLDQTRGRPRAAAVGSQRLTAWAMARPLKVSNSRVWESAVFLLLKRYIYEACHSGWTRFRDDWFWNSSNIMHITWTVWEAAVLLLLREGTYEIISRLFYVAWHTLCRVSWILVHAFKQCESFAITISEPLMLVLLMAGIYELCCWNRRKIFKKITLNIQVILWSLTQQFVRLQCRYYWWEKIVEYVVEKFPYDTIYIPNFMKFCTGVEATLRFFLGNLRGRNIGITDRKDLLCMPMRWAQVAWYTCRVS
jgi:hypothetical protein